MTYDRPEIYMNDLDPVIESTIATRVHWAVIMDMGCDSSECCSERGNYHWETVKLFGGNGDLYLDYDEAKEWVDEWIANGGRPTHIKLVPVYLQVNKYEGDMYYAPLINKGWSKEAIDFVGDYESWALDAGMIVINREDPVNSEVWGDIGPTLDGEFIFAPQPWDASPEAN